MADPLEWKDGEGYDIHVLRGGPTSKALDTTLELDTSSTALPPKFLPHFKGAPSNHGVDVVEATGEVTAAAQPAPPQPKFPNFNFLMTARQVVGGVRTLETKIRIHVHDSIKEIWLTPPILTAHLGFDECRFTVLALFDDGTVGDITDWPQTQFTFTSSNKPVVEVVAGGALRAKRKTGEATITVTWKLTSPPITKSAKAKVFAAPGWDEIGASAVVKFVGGPVLPNETDLSGSNPDSVPSVVDGRTNILFVSEGFRKDQERLFRQQIVDVIVNSQLRTNGSLEPFKLLAKSINYWAVFVESRDEGITVLGDQELHGPPTSLIGLPVPLPRPPAPSATEWTPDNLIHEGGLPLPSAAAVQDPAAWVAERSKLYDIPSGAPSTPLIGPGEVAAWNDWRSRSLLNERDTAFGMAHQDRPRASGQDHSLDRLRLDRRRTSKAAVVAFLEQLRFGKDPAGSHWGIGRNWVEEMWDGKDAGLVCFVCWSGTKGGMWNPAFLPPMPPRIAYFTASTGLGDRVLAKRVTGGHEILPPVGKGFSAPVLASLVAFGCGGALGLSDENGDGTGKAVGPGTFLRGHNVQSESLLSSVVGGVRTVDGTKIAWLWPRILNSGMIEVEVDPSGTVIRPERCDQNGNPSATGAFLLVRLLRPPHKPFARSEVVRLRGLVAGTTGSFFWREPSQDPIAVFPLVVEQVGTDTLVLGHRTPSVPQLGYINPPPAPQLDPTFFRQVKHAAVILPRVDAGNELKLVSPPILSHIDSRDSALDTPKDSQGQTCTPAPFPRDDVTPTNLPSGVVLPAMLPSKADIVGIYDGGEGFDCGVYRPAGRCRMRRGPKATTPFCHVCRYIMVDKIDPLLHGALDAIYDLQYPT